MIKYQLGRFSKYSTRPQNFEAKVSEFQRTVYQRGADSDGKMVNRNAWRRVEDKETQFVTELPGASDPESIFKTDLEFNTWYLD